VDSASGPASPVLAGYGRRVGSLGPGLASDSADAVRAVLRDDLSAGPQVYGTHRREVTATQRRHVGQPERFDDSEIRGIGSSRRKALIRIHRVGRPRIAGARQVDGRKVPISQREPEGYSS
jgi:hypothetical protein